SGVVSVYKDDQLERSIMNLTTSVAGLTFNSTGEALAMWTRRTRGGMRVYHTGSKTVFSNWPTSKTPLGYVWDVDWSRGGGGMTIGTDKGKALGYRVEYYSDI
ncbi:hypothetical protein TrRE_jg3834, partial [Triparma retinervis]